MSRVVVLGAGIVGRAAAWDLARRGHQVRVADIDGAAAASLAAEMDIPFHVLNATDTAALRTLILGADMVVSAVPYYLGEQLAAAAVAAGCHYLDFGGNPTVVAAQRRLDTLARNSGVTVVPDCGLAPGLADVMAVGEVMALGPGPVDQVGIRVGAIPAEPRGALGYQLAFSPGGLINEYAEPCEVLRDGRLTKVDPLTEFEDVDWPGLGTLEAFHTAGGSSSLARLWEGRVAQMDYKTLRYPGHGRVFRSLLELGMFSQDPLGESGLSRRSVLIGALAENLPRGEPDLVLVRTWACARRRGERKSTGHQILDRHDGRFSALARTTAFPATALAHLIVSGGAGKPGVRTMDEAVGSDLLLEQLAPLGILADLWRPA
jgi:lysine 6-dehydrogenase